MYGVKVNHLPIGTREEDLRTVFLRFGSVASISLKNGTGECYAFVNFYSSSCAQAAARDLNSTTFCGKLINCKVQGEAASERRSPSVGEYTVKVTSISKHVTEEMLSTAFCFGDPNCLQSVKIIPCPTGPYAYVNYFSQRDAERAVSSLDRSMLNGSEVRVKMHSGPMVPMFGSQPSRATSVPGTSALVHSSSLPVTMQRHTSQLGYGSSHSTPNSPRVTASPQHVRGDPAARKSSDPLSVPAQYPPLYLSSTVLRAPSYPGASRQAGSHYHRVSSHPGAGPRGTTEPQSCTVKVSIFGTLNSEDVQEVFSQFGTLRDKPIIRGGDPHYAFVNFSTPQAAVSACTLHNSTIRGVKIYVKTHTSQKQLPGVDIEPREVKCSSLVASILSTKWKEELEKLGNQHQVMLTAKPNSVRMWGPREQVAAVELCLQSLLERLQGEISVRDCKLPSHSVPLFEQDTAVNDVRKIEESHGVEFRILRAARHDSTSSVDLASFCQEVKQCFVPKQSDSSTPLPTCSELDSYLTEKEVPVQADPAPTAIIWEWENDSGTDFTPYSSDVSSKLSQAFAKSCLGSLTLEIGRHQYLIDFSTMTQTNIMTDRSRDIRQASYSPDNVQWLYTDDRGQLVPYAAQESDKIEKMFLSRSSTPVFIKDRVYTFDFDTMTQRNVETQHKRKIERHTVTSSKCENEIQSVSQVLTLQASGLLESLEPSLNELRGVIERATVQKECQLNQECSKSFRAELMKNMNKYFVTAELMNDCLRLTGMPRYVERVHLAAEQQKLADREQMIGGGGEFEPPAHWRQQSEEVMLDVVRPHSTEWNDEVESFRKTLRGATIVRLERIQNKWLWERYCFAKKRMLKTNKGHVNEKHLFHGTRRTQPEKVFRSEKGVDFRFSREGLWGTGSYFAVNASYSDAYAYSTPGGINEKQIFICKVLTGDSYNAGTNKDPTLRQPPLKSGYRSELFDEERYDSVKGYTNESHVYVVYDHEKVYPAYLVTYRR